MDLILLKSKLYGVFPVVRLASILLLILFVKALVYAREPAAPVRLGLKVEKNTLQVGDKTKLVVEFLDQNQKPVPNDKERVIEFEQITGNPEQKEYGVISPKRIVVQPEEWFSEVTFEAREWGKLIIKATSNELASAQTLIIINRRSNASLFELFGSIAYAQSDIIVDIFPEYAEPVPANGTSGASLWITLNRPLKANEQVRIKIIPISGSTISYDDKKLSGITITLREGVEASGKIDIVSPNPGVVKISVQIGSGGPTKEASITFEKPRPHRIIFSQEEQTIPSHQTKVPLPIKLLDRDGRPAQVPDRERQIQVDSLTDSSAVVIDPSILALPVGSFFTESTLSLRGFPPEGQIVLQAKDSTNELEPGKTRITLESFIKHVSVMGPREIYSGGREYDLTLSLRDKNNALHAADWDRKIILDATQGSIPESVIIPKGRESVRVKYRSPESVGEVTITAQGEKMDSGTWEMKITIDPRKLVVFAGLGGLLGGLIRYVYKEKVKWILPKWDAGYLNLGLIGNSALSIVFGLFFFQAIDLGVIPISRLLQQTETLNVRTLTAAFFFGVLGGFAGVYVLDFLLDQVFPKRKQVGVEG
jgi:hypothetical protein